MIIFITFIVLIIILTLILTYKRQIKFVTGGFGEKTSTCDYLHKHAQSLESLYQHKSGGSFTA